jgi:hypothetical protein
MVLISRAQGLARIKTAGQRTGRQARPIALRPRLETARAHYRRGDRGGQGQLTLGRRQLVARGAGQ